jgi:hypothetical protein
MEACLVVVEATKPTNYLFIGGHLNEISVNTRIIR